MPADHVVPGGVTRLERGCAEAGLESEDGEEWCGDGRPETSIETEKRCDDAIGLNRNGPAAGEDSKEVGAGERCQGGGLLGRWERRRETCTGCVLARMVCVAMRRRLSGMMGVARYPGG